MDEVQRACVLLSNPPGQPATGMALYQLAELHRWGGVFGLAEAAYRQAGQWIAGPQPGLALLRLAQGQVDAAAAAIRRAVDGAHHRLERSRLLTAYVEIMLAAGVTSAARDAAAEVRAIADDTGAPWLKAVDLHTTGAVLLAEGDGPAAVETLREAWSAWQRIGAPYEAARVRVDLALACRLTRDENGADMELDAAVWVFQQLGAGPDVARVQALSRRAATPAGPLTAREEQVLALVAVGKTNREVAADLFLSEKTVGGHLSDIFGKLGLSNRSSVTAYAYRNGLV
jgi:DNA-binding NarL/FixJ family response regulator